jgi:hypothetical protein
MFESGARHRLNSSLGNAERLLSHEHEDENEEPLFMVVAAGKSFARPSNNSDPYRPYITDFRMLLL